MENKGKSRALLLFENSIKSEHTLRLYNYWLRKFVEYFKLRSIESILGIEDKKLQEMAEDFLFYLKGKVKPNTLKPAFSALELLCITNDKEGVNFRKIHKMYPANERLQGKKSWATKDIQKMLEATKELRTKTVIHLLASTGCRIGAIPDLKLRNIMDMLHGCMAVQFYEGSDEEYLGFLTPEASDVLKTYLNKRKDDGETLDKNNPLFREKYNYGIAKPHPIGIKSLNQLMFRVTKNAGVHGEKVGLRYDTQTNHGFRKRFNTILKLNSNINPAMTEKLIGHKVNLDGTYLTPTREELFEEFRKAILDLTIDDSERLRMRNKGLEKEMSELEKKNQKDIELEIKKDKRVTNLEDKVEKLTHKIDLILQTKESKYNITKD